MRFVMFYHSLLSDWNHGNAHFLRGVVYELLSRGHQVVVYEPAKGWSLSHLIEDHGVTAIRQFYDNYPGLYSYFYQLETLDFDYVLDQADVVIVHEWNNPRLIQRLGEYRSQHRHFKLLFHDTHHRAVSRSDEMSQFDLGAFDGVLVFGYALKEIYLRKGWIQNVWVWHEAADTRLFKPLFSEEKKGELVWIGNWGDEERSAEIEEFFIEPVDNLRLKSAVYGVRYPLYALEKLKKSEIDYRGWTANYLVPKIFSQYRITLHIPRQPYRDILVGIPTIRVFEALACGIPLVCAPWEDSENLFEAGRDFLVAKNGTDMKRCLRDLLHDRDLYNELRAQGLNTIQHYHTCSHRVDELLNICNSLQSRAYPFYKEDGVL